MLNLLSGLIIDGLFFVNLNLKGNK